MRNHSEQNDDFYVKSLLSPADYPVSDAAMTNFFNFVFTTSTTSNWFTEGSSSAFPFRFFDADALEQSICGEATVLRSILFHFRRRVSHTATSCCSSSSTLRRLPMDLPTLLRPWISSTSELSRFPSMRSLSDVLSRSLHYSIVNIMAPVWNAHTPEGAYKNYSRSPPFHHRDRFASLKVELQSILSSRRASGKISTGNRRTLDFRSSRAFTILLLLASFSLNTSSLPSPLDSMGIDTLTFSEFDVL